jgi:hypothetical protein
VGADRRGQRERADRVFRDIHRADHILTGGTVLVHDGHAAGDDHVLRRHWTVVCTDR